MWFNTDSVFGEIDSPHGNLMKPSRLAETMSLYRTVKVGSASPVTTGHWDPSKEVLGQLTDDPTSVWGKLVEHEAKRSNEYSCED